MLNVSGPVSETPVGYRRSSSVSGATGTSDGPTTVCLHWCCSPKWQNEEPRSKNPPLAFHQTRTPGLVIPFPKLTSHLVMESSLADHPCVFTELLLNPTEQDRKLVHNTLMKPGL